MCIADIAISRRCYTKTTTIAPVTATKFAANPDRLIIIMDVFAAGNQAAAISSDPVLAAVPSGYVAFKTINPGNFDVFNTFQLRMDYKDFPGVIQQELWCYSQTSFVNVHEVIMQDDLANELRQYLKEQRSKYGRK